MTGVDVMNHFVLSGSPTEVAGEIQNVTITAIGLSGNTYTGYSGLKNVVFHGSGSIGTYIPNCLDRNSEEVGFDDPISLNFAGGVAVCSMKLYKAGVSNVSVTDSTYASAVTLDVTVSPALIHSFAGGVPTVSTSGIPFIFTLTAKDFYGNNTADVAQDTTLEVNHGVIDPISISSSSFHNGYFIGNITISNVFVDTPVTLTIGNGNINQAASLQVTGIDLIDHLRLGSESTETPAGENSSVTVSIIKADGSVYTDFTGYKNMTFSGSDSLGANIPTFTDKDNNRVDFGTNGILNFIHGVATTKVTLYKAAATTLGASDGFHNTNGNPSYALNLNVIAGAASSFDIEAPSEAKSAESFPLTITAKDEFGNITNDVSDDITVRVSDGSLDTTLIPAAGFRIDGTYIANMTVSGITKDKTVTISLTSDTITKNFTILIKGVSEIRSGNSFISPTKPDISKTKIVFDSGRFILSNLPKNIIQIAVSTYSNFKDASWQDIKKIDEILGKYTSVAKLYLKFRSQNGGVSDVLTFSNSSPKNEKTINDGDIVKTANNPDVYIIKLKNGKQYRRLILSPSVFNSYGHLRWGNIKTIPSWQMNEYELSNLVQVAGDLTIYQLFPSGDTGERRVLDTTQLYDPDSIYEINVVDRDSYKSMK
jgi:hypothetical protein